MDCPERGEEGGGRREEGGGERREEGGRGGGKGTYGCAGHDLLDMISLVRAPENDSEEATTPSSREGAAMDERLDLLHQQCHHLRQRAWGQRVQRSEFSL